MVPAPNPIPPTPTLLRKRFLDWTEPALPRLVATVAASDELATPPELDLRDHLFVFPGSRPGRRFLELLVEASEDRGLRLTPPRTVTMGALPELLYDPPRTRALADPVLSRQTWALALRETRRHRLELLLPDPPDENDLAGWAALADVVLELHADVTREGLDFGAVADRCREDFLFDDSERWKVLTDVRDRYRDRLTGMGYVDRYEARIDALEGGLEEEETERGGRGSGGAVGLDLDDPEPIRAIHLVGVVDMPGVAREMLRRVAGSGTSVTVWIKAPEGLGDRFDDVGCVRPEAWSGVEIPVPGEILSVEDGPSDQATATLRAIAGFDGSYAPDEISVGVPDREVVPWLEQRFRSHGLPHRVAEGTPLERTSAFRLLEAVADYLDGRRFVDLAALLRHPALAPHLADGRGPEIADLYHSRHLPARIRGEMPERRPHGTGDADPPLRDLLARLHGPDFLGPLAGTGGKPRPRPLSEWMPLVLAFLDRVFGGRPLHRYDPSRPDDRLLIEACQRIRGTAASFHRLPGGADRDCTAAQGLRLLLGQLRASGPEAAIPPEPDRAALELLGWPELHLDDAPALVVTGFNEGRVPTSESAHPFLPNALRSALGLRDNRFWWARDAYLLSALLQSRKAVRIVAGRRTGSGDPLRPSRLLLTSRGEALARRVLRFTSTDRATSPPPAPPGVRAVEESAFSTPPDPELHLPEPPETFSVTEFRTLLRDPYRWVLERRLELDALHDQIRELDPLGFGTVAHDVLRDFARSDEAEAPDPRAVALRLDRLLDAVVERRFGGGALPAVPLQIEQLRHRLHAFAEWQARRVAAGWRLIEAELGTPEEGVPFDVDGRPVRLHGRIDRIERHEESGALAVFDYKTGDRARDPVSAHRSRSGEWRDLQLPLYHYLLPHLIRSGGEPLLEDPEGREIHLGYIHLPKEPRGVGASVADWDQADLRAALERARDAIRTLRASPVIAFDPERVDSGPWDPMGALLGRGILTLASEKDEEGGGEDGEGGVEIS